MSKLIMVIDDSATVRKIVETCLHREGFEVNGFPDGIEAMKWLVNEPRIPDLALIDIGLPQIDGYEITRRLKQKPQFASIVIILISRRHGMLDRLKGRLAGAKAYLVKPLKTEELISIVTLHLGSSPQ
ncbi:MAG TPA: response regulator [Ktedonosporobacter sp.]|nr:response regulator [Ktedonosporobacter sp.]